MSTSMMIIISSYSYAYVYIYIYIHIYEYIYIYIYTFILPLGTPKIIYITAGYKTPSIIPLGTKIPLGTNQFFSKLF